MRAFLANFASFFPVMIAALIATVPLLSAADGRFDRTFPVANPLKVDVLSDTGDISVRAGEAGKIEIHARLHSIDESADDDVETRIHAIELSPPFVSDASGHSVRIGHFATQDATRNISISYEIVVPADTELRAETAVGDQSIEGIQGPVDASSGAGKLHVWHIGKDAQVSAGSGDIDLRDVRGQVRVKTGTGNIYASEIGDTRASQRLAFAQLSSARTGNPLAVHLKPVTRTMEIVTGSGDVDVENLLGGLQVTSGSGSIRASGKPIDDWTLDTATGAVRVQFPDGANLALVAHTSSGTIESNDAVTVQGNKNPHELHGQIGKGGPTVDLKTASGNIEIQ